MSLTREGRASAVASLGPVAGTTKAEAAYQELRNRILSGGLAPGVVLEQETLASVLGLSTTPLREALRRLESEELVTVQAHRRVRVAPLSIDELEELYAVRLELDPLAAELAAKMATDEQIAAVEEIVKQRSEDPAERLRINRDLHRSIYVSSGNEVLIRILDSLHDRSGRYRMILVGSEQSVAEAESEHHEIVDAFRRRDGRRLRRLSRAHLLAAKRTMAGSDHLVSR